jgi:hypothetical protein
MLAQRLADEYGLVCDLADAVACVSEQTVTTRYTADPPTPVSAGRIYMYARCANRGQMLEYGSSCDGALHGTRYRHIRSQRQAHPDMSGREPFKHGLDYGFLCMMSFGFGTTTPMTRGEDHGIRLVGERAPDKGIYISPSAYAYGHQHGMRVYYRSSGDGVHIGLFFRGIRIDV